MSRRASSTSSDSANLLVAVVKDGKAAGYCVFDLAAGDYRPLTKELCYRAAAAHPALAGERWRPALRLAGSDHEQALLVTAHLEGADADEPLAEIRVPAVNLKWLGTRLARQLGFDGDCSMRLAVPPDDDPAVQAWREQATDADFEIVESTNGHLVLPGGFAAALPGPTDLLRGTGSWLRCVFTGEAFDAFAAAAARENEVERGWALGGHVHLDRTCAVVAERLVEMPAQARREGFTTTGRDFLALRQALGDSLAGFCHLHPQDHEIGPSPSAADSIAVWDVDAATPQPVVAPIGLFGPAQPGRNTMAAFGYEAGVLREIDLEVLR